MTTDDQRFAPPQAHVDDVAGGEAELAGRGIRLVAAIVDGLIVACAVWALAFLPGLSGLQGADGNGLGFASMLSGFVIFVLVQGYTLVTRGQTLAKIAFGLRIVRSDGGKVDALRILGLRYGIGYLTSAIHWGLGGVYGLVDCLMIFRDSRQCLHDTIADTKVIKL